MKRLVVIAVLISLMAGAIYAQDVPGGFVSPTSAATFGRYRSAADDFIRPDSYTSAKVENWFAMTSFRSGTNTDIGYAKKLGALYVGAYYGGTFWANVANPVYTESTITWHGEADKSGIKTYTIPDLVSGPNPSNRISLLFGIADMGFRFSMYSTLNSFKSSDFLGNGTEYKEYHAANGVTSPQIAWSMTKNLVDGKGIKPWLTLDFNFNRNYIKFTTFDPSDNYKAAEERIGHSRNNTDTILGVGLGGFTLLSKNGFSFSGDLDYTMNIRSWNSDYNYDGADGKNKISSYKGQYAGPGGSFAEETSNSHRIRPSFSGSWSKDNLGLKLKLNLPLTISNEGNASLAFEQDASGVRLTNGSLVLNGNEVKTTTIGFRPQLQLAAQWKVVPKLALNAGGQIYLTALESKSEETSKSYINGKEVDSPANVATKTVTPNHGITASFQNDFALGVALSATDNFTIEAACGVGGRANNNYVSFFQTGNTGLFHFANLLVSVKF